MCCCFCFFVFVSQTDSPSEYVTAMSDYPPAEDARQTGPADVANRQVQGSAPEVRTLWWCCFVMLFFFFCYVLLVCDAVFFGVSLRCDAVFGSRRIDVGYGEFFGCLLLFRVCTLLFPKRKRSKLEDAAVDMGRKESQSGRFAREVCAEVHALVPQKPADEQTCRSTIRGKPQTPNNILKEKKKEKGKLSHDKLL